VSKGEMAGILVALATLAISSGFSLNVARPVGLSCLRAVLLWLSSH
jgi:hypothetical protein